MKKLFGMAALAAALAGPAGAAQLESFDSLAGWAVSGNDISANGSTVSLSLEGTNKTEGTGALKAIYSYSGKQYYEVHLTKTFVTPVSLEDALQFSLKVHGDAATGSNLIWYIRLVSPNGQAMRYVDGAGLGTGSWNTTTFNLRQHLNIDPWASTTNQPQLNAISAVDLVLHMPGATAAGTATIYFDDLQASNTSPDVQLVTVDNFEYANDAALRAAWAVETFQTTNVLSLNTTSTAVQGSTAMQMNLSEREANWRMAAFKTLPEVLDFTQIGFLKFHVRGDSSIPASGVAPFFFVALGDTAGNETRGWVQSAVRNDNWSCFFVKIAVKSNPADTTAWPLEEYTWDAGGNIDLTKINKIGFYYGDGTDTDYNATFLVDKIQYGRVPVPTAAQDWALFE